MKDLQMHTILPFKKHHQSEIDELMNKIQKEFDIPFRNPNSVSIPDYVASGNFFWIALCGEQVIGTIGLTRFDSKTGIIRNMFVAKEHRGSDSGVSRALLNRLLDEAERLTYNSVYLGTMTQFQAAQKFYAKNGFVRIPQTDLPDKMIFNPVDDAFFVLKF